MYAGLKCPKTGFLTIQHVIIYHVKFGGLEFCVPCKIVGLIYRFKITYICIFSVLFILQLSYSEILFSFLLFELYVDDFSVEGILFVHHV